MVIEYLVADNGAVLDTVTLDVDGAATYATGKARRLIEGYQAVLGPEVAAEVLRDWSNGYVSTREVTA